MHKNIMWLVLLVVVAGVALWFVGKASWQLYHYWRLNKWIAPQETTLSVQEFDNDYAVVIKYSFEIGEQTYNKEEIVGNNVYRNPWIPQTFIDDLEHKSNWKVWYNSNNINDATINKIFPTRSVVYAAVVLGILAYFLILGYYVAHQRNHN